MIRKLCSPLNLHIKEIPLMYSADVQMETWMERCNMKINPIVSYRSYLFTLFCYENYHLQFEENSLVLAELLTIKTGFYHPELIIQKVKHQHSPIAHHPERTSLMSIPLFHANNKQETETESVKTIYLFINYQGEGANIGPKPYPSKGQCIVSQSVHL